MIQMSNIILCVHGKENLYLIYFMYVFYKYNLSHYSFTLTGQSVLKTLNLLKDF